MFKPCHPVIPPTCVEVPVTFPLLYVLSIFPWLLPEIPPVPFEVSLLLPVELTSALFKHCSIVAPSAFAPAIPPTYVTPVIFP